LAGVTAVVRNATNRPLPSPARTGCNLETTPRGANRGLAKVRSYRCTEPSTPFKLPQRRRGSAPTRFPLEQVIPAIPDLFTQRPFGTISPGFGARKDPVVTTARKQFEAVTGRDKYKGQHGHTRPIIRFLVGVIARRHNHPRHRSDLRRRKFAPGSAAHKRAAQDGRADVQPTHSSTSSRSTSARVGEALTICEEVYRVRLGRSGPTLVRATIMMLAVRFPSLGGPPQY